MRSLVAVMVVAACGNPSVVPTPDALPPVPMPVFAQTAYIKSSTPLHDSHFSAQALSGDGRTLVGSYEGVATVYERDAGWRMTGDLTPSTPSIGFGWKVAISRDGLTIAVGARDDHPVGNAYAGAVYVFRKSGTAWVEQTRIDNPVTIQEFVRGLALSADGNTLIVSSQDDSDQPRLRTYDYSAGSWTEVAQLDGEFAGPFALAPDGSMMIASTGFATAIDVFARSGNAWVKRATLPASSVEYETSMACSARCERIAIGNHGGAGVAYVFDGDGTTWELTATLLANLGDVGDQFGRAIAISDDGLKVVVGAPGENGAYLFHHYNDTWLQLLNFTGSNSGPNDIFGSRVAVSNDATTIAISAIYENSGSPGVNGDQSDESQPYAGAAYVFEGSY